MTDFTNARRLCQLLAVTVILTLTTCTSTWLAGGLPLLQIPPSDLPHPATLEQRLVISWPGEQRSIEAVLDIDDQRMSLIGMAMGVRLFSMDYGGKQITETQSLPSGMPAERMINDLLLIYTPEDQLQRALPAGWQVRVDSATQRTILRDGKAVIVISYSGGNDHCSIWPQRVVLDNKARYYQLTIDTAADDNSTCG